MTSTDHPRSSIDMAGGRLLGLASIAVGMSELFIPRTLERWLGIGNGRYTGILRILGLRELAHALDILSHEDPAPGVRARVAGDVLDGTLFAIAGARTRRPEGYSTAAALLGIITLLDLLFARRLSRE